MKRRFIKNGGKLDTSASNCVSNIMPVDPDTVDDAETETRKIIKTTPYKKAPENSAAEKAKTDDSV